MSSAAQDPWSDPDDERQGTPSAWVPTPTVPFPRPAPHEDPVAAAAASQRDPDPGAPPTYAPWSRRVLGSVVDLAVMTVPLLLALTYDDPLVAALGVTWCLAWFVGNRVLAQGRTGTTLGRRLTGTQLWHTPDTPPPGARTALVRELAHVLDVASVVGLVRPLWDARARTFADSLCGTTVGRV
jgi:hypothetical protein